MLSKELVARIVCILLLLGAAFKSIKYEYQKALTIPFQSVPVAGADNCPEEYDSDWLDIMRYTQCRGIEFEGRLFVMKRPKK